jgi:tetratricopeptide (TPR) repeat protein
MTNDLDAGGTAGRPGTGDEHWYLNDQREFLLRSIGDAEGERRAGDLAEADYEVLVARDLARLAEVEAELAALGPPGPGDVPGPAAPAVQEPAARSRFGPWRRAGIVASCALIVAGAVILVDHALSPALPGQAPSGSITQTKEQLVEEQLAEAVVLNNEGKPIPALQLYTKVLSEDPDDPSALASYGWLSWNYGSKGRSSAIIAAGLQAEEKAVRLAPTYWVARLYLGLILFNQDHDTTAAIGEFNDFLADGPSKADIENFAPLVAAAYEAAKVPLPAALAAALASAGATTPTTSAP